MLLRRNKNMRTHRYLRKMLELLPDLLKQKRIERNTLSFAPPGTMRKLVELRDNLESKVRICKEQQLKDPSNGYHNRQGLIDAWEYALDRLKTIVP